MSEQGPPQAGNGIPQGFAPEAGESPEMTAAAAAFYQQAQQRGLASAEDDPTPRPPVVGAEEHLQQIVEPGPDAPPSPEGQPPDSGEPAEGEAAATNVLGPEDGDVVVEVDGEQIPLTELMRGNLREADYTRKTTELAEQRRQLEAQQAQVVAQQTQGMQQLQGLIGQLQYELQASQPNPQEMEQLRQTDPGEFAARVAEAQRKQQALAMAQQQMTAYQQQQMALRVPQEKAMLAAKSPQAFAPERFDATYRNLGVYATSPEGGGLSPEEWDQVYDHRHVLLVWKAQQYDEAARSGKALVPSKLQGKPKVIRPGVAQRAPTAGDTAQRDYQASLENLQRNPQGQTQDAVAAAFLAKRKVFVQQQQAKQRQRQRT